MPWSPSPRQTQAREKMIQGWGMCCFDFCSSVKSSKALGLPADCLRSSVLLSSGVPLLGAAGQCCLEPTESACGLCHSLLCKVHKMFADSLICLHCLETFSCSCLSLSSTTSPCWEWVVLGVAVAEIVLADHINLKSTLSPSHSSCLSATALGGAHHSSLVQGHSLKECWVSLR